MKRRDFLKTLTGIGVGLFIPSERLEFGVPKQTPSQLVLPEREIVTNNREIKIVHHTIEELGLRPENLPGIIWGIPLIESEVVPPGLYTVSMTSSPGYSFMGHEHIHQEMVLNNHDEKKLHAFVRQFLAANPDFDRTLHPDIRADKRDA